MQAALVLPMNVLHCATHSLVVTGRKTEAMSALHSLEATNESKHL